MGRSKFERMLNKFVVLVIIVLAVWFLAAIWISRDISFDQGAWKQVANSSDIDIRYRMVSDLMSTIDRMRTPDEAELRTLLGPPLSATNDPRRLVYDLGRSYRGPIPSSRWHLQLVFEDNGHLSEIGAYPDSP